VKASLHTRHRHVTMTELWQDWSDLKRTNMLIQCVIH